jgi:N-succinyldiaminopimelate aminotransferase
MPRFPAEGRSAQGLSDRVYTRLLDRARASGRLIAPLHVGDTYREPLFEARAEAQRAADHPRLHNYAPVQGEPALREAASRYLARRHGASIAPEAIQVLAGGTSGLNVIAQVLFDAGDELLLPSPFWPLIRGIARAHGATPVELPFWTRCGAPGFDVEGALEGAITARTAAIYVNSPNNPTGAALDEARIEALADVAERHALWVICDEAYEEIYFGDPPPAVWLHPRIRERALVVHTLSKSYGLAGSRVAFVHGPEPVMSAVRGAQTFLTYCAPRPLQLGAARALDQGDAWLAESRVLYADAARAAAEALRVPAPTAGTFLFFDTARLGGEAFLERCADAGVILTPGAAAGADYARWARLCFTAVPPGELERALDLLEALAAPA